MEYKLDIAKQMLASKKGSLMGAILAIAIGIFVLSIITILLVGLQNAIIRDIGYYQVGDLIVTNEQENISISEKYLIGWFENNPGVSGATTRLVGSGDVEILRAGEKVELFKVPIIGIDPEKEPEVSKLHETIIEGEFVTSRNSVVVGSYVAEDLGGVQMGELIDLSINNRFDQKQNLQLVVTGISKTVGGTALDSNLIIHVDTLRELLAREGESSSLLVKFDDPSAIDPIRDLFLHSFSHEDFKAETILEFGKEVLIQFNSALVMFQLIGYVGLGSSAFAIVTIQMMLVSSKTREVGILRSIGSTRKDILIIFLTQGVIIGLIGVGVGTALGLGFSTYAIVSGFSFGESFSLEVKYDFESIIRNAITAFILAMVASLYPAIRATKLQPLEAMKAM